MEAVFQFWKKYVGRFGMFNLVLLALENMLGDNFVCPCKHDYNHVICFLYSFVPALGCLICTLLFVDLSPLGENEEGAKSSRYTRERIFYSVLSVFTWVSLFFIDGRFLACAYSYGEGVYTKSHTLGTEKWCKPKGNETSEVESQERNLQVTSISQITGFTLMSVVIVILGVFKYFNQKKPQPDTGASAKPQGGEEAVLIQSSDFC